MSVLEDWKVIGAILIVSLPVLWFLGGFVLKLLWGFWAVVATLAAAGYVLWTYGLEAIIAAPIAILVGVVGCWLWQRTRIYLKVDALIGRLVFFD